MQSLFSDWMIGNAEAIKFFTIKMTSFSTSPFQMRSRISIRGHVRLSVGTSVRTSVGRSVGRSHTKWISEKWAEFEPNSISTKKVCHLKDYSKTNTRAVRQRTHLLSEFCSTYSQTFYLLVFLDATTHFYNRLCPSVRRFVGLSRVIFKLRKTSCPILQ